MDYEKKYKEALEVAQKLYQDCPNGKNDRLYHTTDLEKIFTELRESEDEKIRKELIEHVKDQQSTFISAPDCRDKYEEEENNKYNSWLAWLENIPYTIDREKREGFHLGYKAALEKQGETSPILSNSSNIGKDEQNPDWSIKEKLMLNDIIETTERSNIFKENYQRELIDWLKSLKQRIGG